MLIEVTSRKGERMPIEVTSCNGERERERGYTMPKEKVHLLKLHHAKEGLKFQPHCCINSKACACMHRLSVATDDKRLLCMCMLSTQHHRRLTGV